MPYLPYTSVSAHLDSRCRDSDRYILIVSIRIIRQTLDSTDMSTSNKGKALASTNGVEAYSKEALVDEIYRLNAANAQLT